MPGIHERSRGTGPRATVIKAAAPHPTIAGDRPPRYGEKTSPLTVGRGPVPRQRSIARSPLLSSPSVVQDRLILTRFGSGCSRTTEGESSARPNDRGGQAPALRLSRPPPLTVGRGPVPRHAAISAEPSRQKSRPGGLSYRLIRADFRLQHLRMKRIQRQRCLPIHQ